MSTSRLDEIRNKLRASIKDATNQSIDNMLPESKRPSSTPDAPRPHSFCHQCGHPFTEPTKFCPGCGASQAGAASASMPSARSMLASSALARRSSQLDAMQSSVAEMPLAVRRALFIGNNTYEGSPLKNCINDAREMSTVFSDIGYQVTTAFDLTCERSRIILERFKEDIVPGDEVVFSFAGHGGQVNSENYLMPIDMQHESQAINLQKEIDDMKACGARMILAIIDACRPQKRVDFYEEIGLLQAELVMSTLAQAKSRDQTISGHGIVFATSHGAYAGDGGGDIRNGVFTHYFLQEVRVQGRTIEQVIEAVKEKVMAHTEGDQVPAFHNELSGKFYFTQ
jgi:hypothetical protein